MSSEMLKQLYLAQSTLGQDFFAEDIGNLLDRNTFLSLGIRCCTIVTRVISIFSTIDPNQPQESQGIPDNTISTLSKLFRHSISLIDDEVLVEDLEDLSAL